MTFSDVSWLLLVVSLPAANAATRVRIWRAVKTQGCRALRDGAYLPPLQPHHEHALQELADECIREGGGAWLMFDCREEYAELRKTWKNANGGIPSLAAPELARLQRKLQRESMNRCRSLAASKRYLTGARERLADADDSDDARLGEMSHVLDSLYPHFQRQARRTGDTGVSS